MEERKPLSWGEIGIVAVLALAVLFCLPKWQVKQAKVDQGSLLFDDEYQLAKLEDEYRRTLAQILGGLGLLYGLSLAERRIVATEKNVRVALKNVRVAQENVSVAQETVRVAEEGHITERFTKAIAQLGDDNMAIRLGGIYALERIAKDSERDHGPVMEVLTAYVREKAPRKNDDYKPQAAERPTTDIQAILTVIGRRETTGKGRRNDRLDLSNTHLAGIVLWGAHLRGADLRGAALSGAALSGAALSGADLDGADLDGAVLSGANLSGANMWGANLCRAHLREAHLDEAKNLTAEQVQSAQNWYKATLPDDLPDSVRDLTNLLPDPYVPDPPAWPA